MYVSCSGVDLCPSRYKCENWISLRLRLNNRIKFERNTLMFDNCMIIVPTVQIVELLFHYVDFTTFNIRMYGLICMRISFYIHITIATKICKPE